MGEWRTAIQIMPALITSTISAGKIIFVFINLFSFSVPAICARRKKLKTIHGHKNSVEQREKTAARRLKAHYGRLTGRIREAGNNSARKAARPSLTTAMPGRKKSISPDFPAKSKAQPPEREAKFDV